MGKAERIRESEVFWFFTYRNPPVFHADKQCPVNRSKDRYGPDSLSRATIPTAASRNLEFCGHCAEEYRDD
jgi:hypothetical protein